MGNAALSPAPAEAATAAWRAPPAKDKGPRRPPRAPRPSEPKAVREAIPLPADVLPHLFSYSCAREVGTFRFLVSRGASAQLIATAELAPTLADAERRGYCESPAFLPRDADRGRGGRRRSATRPPAARPGYRYRPAGPLGAGWYSGSSHAETPALRDALRWRRGGDGEPEIDVRICAHPASDGRDALVVVQCYLPKPPKPETVRLADGRFVEHQETPWHRFRPPNFEPGMPEGATVRFYGAASFEEARDYATPGDDGAARWALGRVAFHSYGFVRDAWPPERSPTSFLTNADVGQSLYLPVRRVSAPRRADRQWRDDLCGNQIFNPTSICAYATVSTQALQLGFENSTRAIDPSKNQPNRLRCDRAREFSSLVRTTQTSG